MMDVKQWAEAAFALLLTDWDAVLGWLGAVIGTGWLSRRALGLVLGTFRAFRDKWRAFFAPRRERKLRLAEARKAADELPISIQYPDTGGASRMSGPRSKCVDAAKASGHAWHTDGFAVYLHGVGRSWTEVCEIARVMSMVVPCVVRAVGSNTNSEYSYLNGAQEVKSTNA